MEKNIRGIQIDAEKRTVKEVRVIGDYKAIYPFINCDCFTVVGISDTEGIYVDDEGLLKEPKHFFMYQGYPEPLAGNGLILGTNDEGDSVDTQLTVEFVRKQIKCADRNTIGLLVKMGAFA